MKIYNQLNNFRRVLLTITIAISIKGAKGQVELINTPVNYKTLAQANSEYDNKAINTNLAVGAIEGKFEVTLSGAATYQIAPDIPSGIKGLVPSIMVQYSSQYGNSLLGQSWVLQGLSSITRIPKTTATNDKNEGVKFNGDDYFALDGNIIVPYGSNGDYRTLKESYNIITRTMGYNGYTDCPDHFIVKNKDGWITEYGKTNDSKYKTLNGFNGNTNPNVITWKINKITDNYGNYILFKYKEIAANGHTNSTHVIDEITYTHNAGLPNAVINKLKFKYEVRKDVNAAFTNGAEYIEGFLLKSIESYSGINLYSALEFNYSYDQNASFLTSTVKKNRLGEMLNDTKLKYEQFNTTLSGNRNTPDDVNNEVLDNRSYGDFNGDGYSDFIASEIGVFQLPNFQNAHFIKKYKVYLNKKDGSFRLEKEITNISMLSDDYEIKTNSLFYSFYNKSSSTKQDIFTLNMSTTDASLNSYEIYTYNNGFTSQTGNFLLGNKTSFFPNYNTTPLPASATPPVFLSETKTVSKYGKNWRFHGDFDGDGYTDILMILEGKCNEIWRTVSNIGQVKNEIRSFSKVVPIMFVANNNIIAEDAAITISTTDINEINNAQFATAVDMDGDGVHELMTTNLHSNTAKIYKFIKTTKTFAFSYSFTMPNNVLFQKGLAFGDFNGDGKTDILSYVDAFGNNTDGGNYNSNPSSYIVAYSNGYNFEIKRNLSIPNLSYQNHETVYRNFMVADFNMDGRSDIFEIVDVGKEEENQNGQPWTSHNQIVRTFYSNGQGFDLHTNSIVNQHGLLSNKMDILNFKAGWVKVADINGDGFPDLTHASGFYVGGGYNSTYFNTHLTNPNAGKSKLMIGLKNGYNNEVTINYDRLNSSTSVYQGSSKIPMRVASSYSVPDGIGGIQTTKMKYIGLAMTSSQFKGFLEVVKTNDIAQTYERVLLYPDKFQNLDLQYVITGRWLNNQTYPVIEKRYDYTDYDFSQTSVGIGSKRYIRLLDKLTTKDYLTDFTKTEVYSYGNKANEYNLISQNITDDLNFETTNVSFLNYISAASPFSNKPQNIVRNITRTGKPTMTNETKYEYNTTTGDIEYEIINKGMPCETKISYDYDVVGNIWKKTTLPIGSAANPIYCGTDGRIRL